MAQLGMGAQADKAQHLMVFHLINGCQVFQVVENLRHYVSLQKSLKVNQKATEDYTTNKKLPSSRCQSKGLYW
jgi:hypothetical protein